MDSVYCLSRYHTVHFLDDLKFQQTGTGIYGHGLELHLVSQTIKFERVVPWFRNSRTITISGPLNFVTVQQLVDLLHENNEIEIIDLSNTNHIDYIAMQTLKDLLSNDEKASEDAQDDQSRESDENPTIKVILPIDCRDAFKKYLTDANILILDHDSE